MSIGTCSLVSRGLLLTHKHLWLWVQLAIKEQEMKTLQSKVDELQVGFVTARVDRFV